MNKRPLLKVRWADVSSFDGWRDIKEAAEKCKPFNATMIGWEVRRSKEFITLATAFSGKEGNGWRVIPLGCIKSIKQIKE